MIQKRKCAISGIKVGRLFRSFLTSCPLEYLELTNIFTHDILFTQPGIFCYSSREQQFITETLWWRLLGGLLSCSCPNLHRVLSRKVAAVSD